jgi:hypothetical protein
MAKRTRKKAKTKASRKTAVKRKATVSKARKAVAKTKRKTVKKTRRKTLRQRVANAFDVVTDTIRDTGRLRDRMEPPATSETE